MEAEKCMRPDRVKGNPGDEEWASGNARCRWVEIDDERGAGDDSQGVWQETTVSNVGLEILSSGVNYGFVVLAVHRVT